MTYVRVGLVKLRFLRLTYRVIARLMALIDNVKFYIKYLGWLVPGLVSADQIVNLLFFSNIKPKAFKMKSNQ